jgi:hypothetical protein
MGFGSLAFPEELLMSYSIRHKRSLRQRDNVADLDKLASLVRICGFLMQTEAYLLWFLSRAFDGKSAK